MDVTFDDSMGELAQSWIDFKKNKDINICKIRTRNISDWVVKKCLENVA